MTNIYERALLVFFWFVAFFFGLLVYGRFGWVGIIITIIISYLILLGIPNLIERINKRKN